ncbi:MAG: DUF433 domain-containing protein [Leptospiraceae bacterium]|nr:DUF433 domain-containing protein [Leptospiraceae bacterium]
MEETDYINLISINPNIRFGKPCIKGTRIAIVDILGWLTLGMSYEEIYENFPEIRREHILVALSYASKREEITRLIIA